MKKVHEFCQKCATEVELEAKLMHQICPSCGKTIFPCSMCESNCINCPLERKRSNLYNPHHFEWVNIKGRYHPLVSEKLVRPIIDTRFEVSDEVFFMQNNKVENATVEQVTVCVEKSKNGIYQRGWYVIDINYRVNHHIVISSTEVYASKQELLSTL